MTSPHIDYGSTEGSGHLRSHAPDPVPLNGVGLCSEEQEQLLANQGARKNRATSTEKRRNKDVIFNTANALLGASMFSMPWAFEQAGVIGGSISLFCVAYIAYETARALLMAQRALFQRTGNILSYPEIASEILGSPRWGSFVRTATIISCIGGCCGYMIFLGQVCQQLFSLTFVWAVSGLCVPLILVSWIRSFHELAYFTIIGVFAIVLSVVAIVSDGVAQSDEVFDFGDVNYLDPASTLQFLGVVTFTFTIHYCVLSMGEEVLHRGKDTPLTGPATTLSTGGLTKPLTTAYFWSSCCICALGVLGYIAYRHSPIIRDVGGNIIPGCESHVCQNIILNLFGGWIRNFVGVALVISLALSYIVILVPAREHIERFILSTIGSDLIPVNSAARTQVENVIRALLVIGTALVAIRTPYFGSVLGTVGGFTDAMQSFVIPPLIFLKLNENNSSVSTSRRFFFRFVFMWGVTLVLCTTFLVLQMFL